MRSVSAFPASMDPFACRSCLGAGGALALFGCALLLPLRAPAAVRGHARAMRAASGLRGSTNGRSPAYLGIEFHDADDSAAASHPGLGRGAEVVMVDHDGPAGKAGLHARDIIVSLNGQAISGAEALRRMIHDAGAGVQIALTVIRSGQLLTLNAQLAERDAVARAAMARLAASNPPPPALAPAEARGEVFGFFESGRSDTAPEPQPPLAHTPPHNHGLLGNMLHGAPFTGAVLDAMEPQLASYFGAPQGEGLLVESVVVGSPAAVAGLRAGDVVLRLDMATLRTTNDWTRHLHASKGRPVTLFILRERHELTLTLQPDLKHHSMVEWPSFF